MTTTITPEELYFGAPASLTFNGVECGATVDAPKVSFAVTTYTPEFQGAKGPVKGTAITTKVIPSVEFTVNQITAQKLAWAMPGSASADSECIGVPATGTVLSTTLAADPALGATTLDLTAVTNLTLLDFVRIGPASGLTELNSEVVQVTTVGTGGGTNTVVQNSAGGGCLIDHGNGEQVKTVFGTILAAPAVAGDTNIKVDAVSLLSTIAPTDIIRIGYVGHYETRVVTAVGTAGPAGTGVSFAIPLTRDHSLDEWVIVVAALGSTTITWTPGRIDSSAYQTLVLTGLGLDGRQLIFTLYNAMSAESQELDFSDSAVSGLKVKFTGHYAAATPTVAPFDIQLV
jgi:hypothetical protein